MSGRRLSGYGGCSGGRWLLIVVIWRQMRVDGSVVGRRARFSSVVLQYACMAFCVLWFR